MSKMADENLDVLSKRLDDLEKLIFGQADKDVSYPKDTPQVTDTLSNINNQIQTAVSGKRRIEAVMRRLNEIETYLDPSYEEKLTLSKEAKIEIILAEEELIRQQAANLEKVKNMVEVLNSEHIKTVPSLQGKLHELSKIHIRQQDDTSSLTEETKNLLLQYNTAITLLSKQFIKWDELVSKLEASSKPRKEAN